MYVSGYFFDNSWGSDECMDLLDCMGQWVQLFFSKLGGIILSGPDWDFNHAGIKGVSSFGAFDLTGMMGSNIVFPSETYDNPSKFIGQLRTSFTKRAPTTANACRLWQLTASFVVNFSIHIVNLNN